jgi:2,5-diketo-D-gluconate reductase A
MNFKYIILNKKLYNIKMIGIGTKIYSHTGETENDIAKIVTAGLKMGYTFIDLEESNENSEGKINNSIIDSIINSKIARSKLFIAQKTYITPSDEHMKLRTHKLKYLDLYYMANPPITSSRLTFNAVANDIWRGMIDIKKKGFTKSIGICNFQSKQLKIFLEMCDEYKYEYPEYAYLEIHPMNHDKELIELYKKSNIKLIAFTALGMGTELYSDNPNILKINKNWTNVILEHTMNTGGKNKIGVVIKTGNVEHLKQNMQIINLNKKQRFILDEMNIYSPINNDTANAIIANGELP